MKRRWILAPLLALCFFGTMARAQGGGSGDGPCDDSPENPTAILMVLGSAGAGLAALRVKMKARSAKRER